MSKWSWLNEGAESAPVTRSDLEQLEAYADRLFGKVGIDVEFTQHFLDRVNDERNQRQITLAELTRLFKQEFKKWGKKIAQLGPDAQAVMKDMKTDVNMPFVLVWDANNQELDLIAKTVMRKDNFKTSNPEFAIEDAGAAADLAMRFGQFNLEEIKQLAIVLGVSIPVLKTMFYTVSGINKIKRALKNIGKKKTSKTKGIFAEVAGVGIIDAQNTTADVKPGETQRQAAKLGIKLNKHNEPPLLHSKATKNSHDANKVAQLVKESAVLVQQYNTKNLMNFLKKLTNEPVDQQLKKAIRKELTKRGIDLTEVEQIDVKKDDMGISPDLFQDALDGSGAELTGGSVKNYAVAKGKHGNTIYYFLLDDNEPFGMLKLVGAPGRGKMSMAMMLPEYQGQGVMPGLYKVAIQDVGVIKSDVEQSAGGTAVWKKLAQDPDLTVYAYDEKSDEYAMVDNNLDSKFSTLNRAQDIKDLEAEETKELAQLLDLQLSGEIDRAEYKRRVERLRQDYEKEILDAQDPGSVYFVATMKEDLTESFDNPYRLDKPNYMYYVNKWSTQAQSPTHTIKFLGKSSDNKKGPGLAWEFEFGTVPHRGGDGYQSFDKTGEGDAQRVFATAIAALKMFIDEVDPSMITFTADKGDDGASRTKLYQRMVKRLAPQMGFKPIVAKGDSMDTFTLVKELAENFADGKKPGRKGLAKRVGVDCSKSVTALRKIAKNSSGEKQRMAHWCANMKSGRKKK